MSQYPNLTAFAFEELDVSSTAKVFTQATAFVDGTSDQAVLAVCTVEDDAVRWRDDGLAPTATVGQLEPAGTRFEVKGAAAIKKFQVIRVTGDADVSVSYYREGP